MAEETLLEPLVADQEGFEWPFDNDLLKETLAALDAAEAGGGDGGEGTGSPPEHVEDEDVYKMKELIREKPKDVLQYLEEEGVVKLGEFDIQDAVAFRAFGQANILTMGADHFEVDWEPMWRETLAEHGRQPDVKSTLGWSTKVTLEAHVVNLRDAAAEGSRGLLQPLLKRFHAHGCSATVFALPAVQAVINFKWTSWARKFLLYELACYCCWLAAFTAFTLLFQAEDWSMTLWQALQDRVGFLCVVFSVLSLVPMSAFLYMELCMIAAYGWGWVRAWNLLDMASYVLQVVICVLHLQRKFVDEGFFSVLVATQQVLLWIKLHYFARAFHPTRNTLIDTIRIVVEDMKWFLVFLSLTMVGFGLAFYALFRQDRSFPDFANVWHSFASMFSYMLAMFDYNVFYNSTNPTAAMLLFIAFEFVMNVLMLNVLIASMTNSFSKLTQDEGLRLLHSKAEIIDELEATLPSWVRSGAWYPAFIHILKIHPDATYEVNLNSVWSGIGLMEDTLLGAQQETRLRVEELEDRLAKLHKKLDVLIKLFIGSLGPSSQALLSLQATLHGAAAGGGSGLGAAAGAGGGAGARSQRSSSHATSPMWQGRPSNAAAGVGLGGINSLTLGAAAHGMGLAPGGRYLRHALTQMPEQLAAVSGPLMAPVLHMGGALGVAQQQQIHPQGFVPAGGGLARHSGPPGLWYAAGGAAGGAGSLSGPAAGDAAIAINRSGSGPSYHRAAGAAHGSNTSGLASEQQLHVADGMVRAGSGSAVPAGGTGGNDGLYRVGSGYIGPLLAQQQVLQQGRAADVTSYTVCGRMPMPAHAQLIRLRGGVQMQPQQPQQLAGLLQLRRSHSL